MDTYTWYASLTKPFFAPPPWVFGPVWSLLYVGIIYTFATVCIKAYKGDIPAAVALPFVLNILCNIAFTYIQMGLQSNAGASIDIVFILGTLLWAMYAVYPYLPWVAYAQVPYLAWVSFATVLQFSITYLNWGR